MSDLQVISYIINKQDGIFWFDVKNGKQLEISKALSKCV